MHRYSPPSNIAYDRPQSSERQHTMLTAPSLNRRATDMDGHPYHRPLQSEIVPTRYGGYSSHNPTHIMQSVETTAPKSNKTRRREAWQIDILEAFYRHVSHTISWRTSADPSQKHMPDKSEKEMLAARINDTLKYVNIWFQNRRQAAQKKGELRPRETYENWRTRRRGGSYDGFPTPPEHVMAGASSYFGRSYPPPTMMHPLITPGEEDRRLSPAAGPVSPNAGATSPFAFRLALPSRPVYEAPRYPQEYDRQTYDRTICTPPYTSEGPPQQGRPVYTGELPPIERSATMRREAPAPTFGGFDVDRRRSLDRKLPAMPKLEAPNSGTTASSALPSPRKESLTSEGSSSNSGLMIRERSSPSDLKLPPITSLLPDHMSDHIAWTSAMRNRRP